MDLIEIFKEALSAGASDIILSAYSTPMFRIGTELLSLRTASLSPNEIKKLIYSILSESQIVRFEREKELDFSFTLDGKYRFRGNLFLQRNSIGAAFRLIPRRIPTLEELNLPPIIGELALYPQGFVIVTGPTAQGKSTTQAAMIELVNNIKRAHIITIEDPIEFVFQNKKSIIEQREVGEDTHSFSSALRHVLRQNPDIILIGEMRDLESIQAALTAAETGHLVISTLHTNDAVQAIDRLLDVFPPHQQDQIRTQLAFSLLAVIAQRLIPKLDGKGLIVACEILRNSPAVANLIREQKTHQLYTIMQTSAKEGMKTMDAALKDLYLQGLISYEECKKRLKNPMILERYHFS